MFGVGNQRKAHTPEDKDEAVKLVINVGRAVVTVACELGIVEQALSNRVRPTGPAKTGATML